MRNARVISLDVSLRPTLRQELNNELGRKPGASDDRLTSQDGRVYYDEVDCSHRCQFRTSWLKAHRLPLTSRAIVFDRVRVTIDASTSDRCEPPVEVLVQFEFHDAALAAGSGNSRIATPRVPMMFAWSASTTSQPVSRNNLSSSARASCWGSSANSGPLPSSGREQHPNRATAARYRAGLRKLAQLPNHPVTLRVPPLLEQGGENCLSPPLRRRGRPTAGGGVARVSRLRNAQQGLQPRSWKRQAGRAPGAPVPGRRACGESQVLETGSKGRCTCRARPAKLCQPSAIRGSACVASRCGSENANRRIRSRCPTRSVWRWPRRGEGPRRRGRSSTRREPSGTLRTDR